MKKGLSYEADRVFEVKGFKPEIELNASIGSPGDSFENRKKWYQSLKDKIRKNPYFVSPSSTRFAKDFLIANNLPCDMLQGATVPNHHRTNKHTLKINYDTLDLAADRALMSVQVEMPMSIAPGDRPNEICIKLRFGEAARMRAELEQSISAAYPDFKMLKKVQRDVIEDRLGFYPRAKDFFPWIVAAGNNWSYEFMPGGDKNTLIKAKLDLRRAVTALDGRVDIVNAELELKYGDPAYLDEAFEQLLSFRFDNKKRLIQEERTKGQILFAPLQKKLKTIEEAGGMHILRKKISHAEFRQLTGIPGYDMEPLS